MRPRQRPLAGQQLFETSKGGGTTAAMGKRFVRIEAAGIFIAVKMRLERPIKPLEKRLDMIPVGMNGRKPTIRVMLIECPEHDVAALVDHPASGTLQNRNRGLGRGCQKGRRLVTQQNLAQLDRNAGSRNRKPRPHRIGAAAKTPEDWEG